MNYTSSPYLALHIDKLTPDMRERIDGYWSRFLGCPLPALRQPHSQAFAHPQASGLFAVKTSGGWIARIGPDTDPAVASALDALHLDDPASVEHAQDITQRFGLGSSYGPLQLNYCTPESYVPDTPVSYRLLTPEDRDQIEAFRATMGRFDWDFDDTITWPVAFGVFDDGQLVSAAQVRVWDDVIGEIFGDTLDSHRKLGYAKALVRVATQWIFDHSYWIPQTDAQIDLIASIRIMRGLGYKLYGWFLMAESSQA